MMMAAVQTGAHRPSSRPVSRMVWRLVAAIAGVKHPAEGAVPSSFLNSLNCCPLRCPEVLQPLPGGSETCPLTCGGCTPSFFVFSPNLISRELNSTRIVDRWRDEAKRATDSTYFHSSLGGGWGVGGIHPHSSATEAISITWRRISHFSFLSSITENDCY